jgi:hypothetical protein
LGQLRQVRAAAKEFQSSQTLVEGLLHLTCATSDTSLPRDIPSLGTTKAMTNGEMHGNSEVNSITRRSHTTLQRQEEISKLLLIQNQAVTTLHPSVRITPKTITKTSVGTKSLVDTAKSGTITTLRTTAVATMVLAEAEVGSGDMKQQGAPMKRSRRMEKSRGSRSEEC